MAISVTSVLVILLVVIVIQASGITNRRATSASPSVQVATEEHKQEVMKEYNLKMDMERAVRENWVSHCWATSSQPPSLFTNFSRFIGAYGLVSLTEERNGDGFSGVSFRVQDTGSSWSISPSNESPLVDDKFPLLGNPPYRCEAFSVSK